MEWTTLLSRDRLASEASGSDAADQRSDFEKDADRIIFSGAFRRLSRKTQVHPFAANDHVHTRLTHSVETSRVGRSLGKALYPHIREDLPNDISADDIGSIVQAACFAHDIGNPPFGHAGEKALEHWFDRQPTHLNDLDPEESYDISSFDGNAQGFRIITQTDNHLFDGGLRLTYSTLASFLKYPVYPTYGVTKFSVFRSELEILDKIASRVGLPKHEAGGYQRHPLAYLVEAADDICYSVLDLEDAVELGIIPFEEVADLLLSPFDTKEADSIRSRFEDPRMFRINLARLRGPVFSCLVKAAIEGFLKEYRSIMNDEPPKGESAYPSVFELLNTNDERAKVIFSAKKMGRERIYKDRKKVEIELGAFATMDALLSSFFDAAKDRFHTLENENIDDVDVPGSRNKLIMELLGDHKPTRANAPREGEWTEYLCYRRAIDFISGMTDNYATYIASQIRGLGISAAQRP